MIKPKAWSGKDLKGKWLVTFKIDGVRCIIKDGEPKSRNGKKLFNILGFPDGDYEVYCGSWEQTIGKVRSMHVRPVLMNDMYSLDPLDTRLIMYSVVEPRKEQIKQLLNNALSKGYEGIVLRQGDTWLKVKRKETYDVKITGLCEGQGRLRGTLGAITTPKGKVGTGLTDSVRAEIWKKKDKLLGTIIEVECMELTKNGMFRHPVFKRVRFDK